MGIPSTLILHLSPTCLHHLFSTHSKFFQNPNFSSKSHCLSSSNFNWSSSFIAFRSRRFQFEDEFGRRKKRRNWWSDDDDDDEDDNDDGDDDDLEFELWDQSPIPVKWLFKIFRTFGWMIPVIVISTLQGTESKSLIMAVVLPLGQTVLSLVMDKMWGGPSSSPEFRPWSKSRSRRRSRSRRGRNPFAGTANRGNRGAREARFRPRSTNGYQSWQTTNNPSSKEGRRNNSKFGGWDELDQQVASDSSFTEAQTQKVDDLEIE